MVTFKEVLDDAMQPKLVPQTSSGMPVVTICHDPIVHTQALNKSGSDPAFVKTSGKVLQYKLHAIIYNWEDMVDCLGFQEHVKKIFNMRQLFVNISNLFTNPTSEYYIGTENLQQESPEQTLQRTLHFCILSNDAMEVLSGIKSPLYREIVQYAETGDTNLHKSKTYNIAYKFDSNLYNKYKTPLQ